jgi:hypothetical protein
MFSAEQQKASIERVQEAIYGIQDFGTSEVSSMAKDINGRISKKELVLVPSSNITQPRLIPTDFDMHEISSQSTREFTGALILDIGKILSLPSKALQADLVRTVAVASQYPYNGYQERYRTVYSKALSIQKDWMTQWGTMKVEVDPRESTDEELLLKILGEERFYTDTGFTDWIKASTDYYNVAAKHLTHDERVKLVNSAYSMDQFLSVRHAFTSMAHNTALSVIGNDYLDTYSQEQRSSATAMLFLGLSTHASS